MKVKNNIQKIGYFWLPSDPSNKLAGLFTIEDGGVIKLEFHGLFGSNPNEQWEQWEWDIILGDVEEYGKITLVDSSYSKEKKHGHGVKFKNFIECDYAFVGAHFNAKDDLIFNNFLFRIEGLNDWMGISGISINKDFNNPFISYNMPDDLIIGIDDILSFAVTYRANRTLAFHALGANDHAEVHQDTYLKLSSSENFSFSEFFVLVKKIANFLIFAINKQVSIDEITVHQEGLNISCTNGKELNIPQDVTVYTNQILHTPNLKEVNWNTMMFRYRDIDSIEDTINKWLNMYEVIDPSLDLYFSTIFSKDRYVKSHFLMLAQALEALHSRTSNGKITFLERLKILCQEFIDMKIYTQEEMDDFAKKIKDTRNYLTHYDKSKEDKIIADDEYQVYINTMKWLLQIHFLKLLGFEQDKIYKFLRFDQLVNKS